MDAELREQILRFYAYMTDTDYETVVDEYLGKTDKRSWTNKLYMGVEKTSSILREYAQQEIAKASSDIQPINCSITKWLTTDDVIFNIEDYVGGNIEGVEHIDRMGFTVFLRNQLETYRKQHELELLDRLIAQEWSFGEGDDAMAVPTRYIEAERNKLKEAK